MDSNAYVEKRSGIQHSEEGGSSEEPSVIQLNTSKWVVTPKKFPFS